MNIAFSLYSAIMHVHHGLGVEYDWINNTYSGNVMYAVEMRTCNAYL